MAHEITKKIDAEIAKYNKPANRIDYQRWFKEKLKYPVGLKTEFLKKISNECFKDVKNLPKKEMLALCNELFVADKQHYRYFANEWTLRIKDQLDKNDFPMYVTWLEKYADNWGTTDVLSGGPIGIILDRHPELYKQTSKWVKSPNRWLRRAAAVSLIPAVKNRNLLDNVFQIADKLLLDDDEMVQKGYGWMLKEAANQFPDEVFEFVMARKETMPRTALRYAIEKYPAAMKKKAMAK
jgi:3-methyladenine DNA glycosylase AlkD